MKKIYGFLGAVALFALASCSNEEPGVQGPTDQKEGDFYMTMTISTPLSRTTTPNQGSEEGKDYENAITSGLLVLAEGDDYNVVAAAEVSDQYITGLGENSYTATFTMVREDLAASLAEEDQKSYYVFFIANAPTTYNDKIVEKKGEPIQDVIELLADENTYWQKGRFLMTNAAEAKATIKKEDVEPGKHAKRTDALNLGEVVVQRAMARFDINTSKTVFTTDEEKSPLKGVTFTVDAVALINQATTANLFKEVGTKPTEKKMFALETRDNYVFSPVQTQYTLPLFGTGTEVQEGLMQGQSKDMKDLKWTLLKDITEADNEYKYKEEGDRDKPNDDYYIWRYCMENSNYDLKNQKHGNTTGVVFRAEMTFDASFGLEGATEAIYAWDNTVVGTYAMLKEHAESRVKAKDEDRITLEYLEAINAAGESASQDAIDAALKTRGFKKYEPQDGKYICYYVYWVRHNDNNMDTVMGANEFSIVRNNIYKLALTKINALGTPGKPGDDNTDTDDELDQFWGEITVKVLDWEVRINNIEF